MKVRYDSRKESRPERDEGIKVLYGPSKRTAFRLRWYLILFLVASPFLWFLGKLLYEGIVVDAPARLVIPAVDVRAQEAGFVSAIHVEEGERVDTGQPLISLDNPDLRLQLAQLPEEIRAPETDPQLIDTQHAALERLRDRARRRAAAVEDLYQKGAATRGEVLEARNRYDSRQSDLLAFERRVADGEQLSPSAIRDRQRWQRERELLGSRLKSLEISAAQPGRVRNIPVVSGESVGPGTLLLRLEQQLDPVLLVYLEPQYLSRAMPGEPLRIRLPDGSWMDAVVAEPPAEVSRLPPALRSPFRVETGMVVRVRLAEPLPQRWHIHNLSLDARFPNIFSNLFQ